MTKIDFITGDALEELQKLPDKSVDCVVTSPPYWGQRDYGVSKQIGLENTLNEYLASLETIFDEIYRCLKDTGTVWVCIGDSYNCNRRGGSNETLGNLQQRSKGTLPFTEIKAKRASKSLLMVPARFALNMIDKGWILRNEIIWHKTNAMPESVKDRCTKAHEMIYFFTKKKKYFYNAEAIKTPSKVVQDKRSDDRKRKPTELVNGMRKSGNYPMANARDVWSLATQPYKGAHFAVFPEAIATRCILAGSPSGGLVLDPFIGSGTTALVAKRLKRDCIGIDVNADYIDIAKKRLDNAN